MDKFELTTEVQDTLTMLDVNEEPQAYQYLAGLLTNGVVTEDPYIAANNLLQCDKPEPLSQTVRDLIVVLFQAAFDAGNADAMNDLGAQYYDGSRGFEQDYGKAVEYYNMAAQNGSRQAQENLGYCYYYGRNVPVDYEKAFHYFALGAFDGHLISLYKIGDMYANGLYVEKNEKEAFQIYIRCINTMTDEAAEVAAGPIYLRLGKCFLNGIGVEKDAKAALMCFQKAESFLYDMVKDGNAMYHNSLKAAVDGQEKARRILTEELINQ